MAYVCACYFMNYLDRQAFANAYVRQDMNFELNGDEVMRGGEVWM
jgi:ACS family pantothenate transporter-like MFS transporter